MTRLAQPVWDAVHLAAAEQGMSLSQYLADVLALCVGRPDLVSGESQEVLPLAM